MRLAADKPWTFKPGARRTNTGHVTIGAEASRFTYGLSYAVLVVTDSVGDLATTSPTAPSTRARSPACRTWCRPPRRPFEQWNPTQLQFRFQKLADRAMTPLDYGA